MVDHYLVTAILPKGKGLGLIEKLHVSLGIDTATLTTGRGRSAGSVASISYGEWAEVDMLDVLVDAEEAERVFAFLFFEGDVGRPRGGLVYMAALGRHTPFVLPDIPDEGAVQEA